MSEFPVIRHTILHTEDEQSELGARLASLVDSGFIIFLHGDLGTGKTTLARGFIRGGGYSGPVRSPTYTLVEPYPASGGRTCYHFDLYRLSDPEELEFTGARDYFDSDNICLVEWPEKAAGHLPEADWYCSLEYHEQGRKLEIRACSERGVNIMLHIFPD